MKGYGKRLFAFALTMMLAGTTLFAPLIAKADNETLIKKSTETSGKNELTFDMSGDKPVLQSAINNNLCLYVKRDGDTFDIFQIAYIEWRKTSVNGSSVVNADIKWVPELEVWMKENKFTDDGTTTGNVLQPTDYGAAQIATGSEADIIDLLNAIKEDEEGIYKTLKEKYLAGYHNDKTDPKAGCSTATETYKDPAGGADLNRIAVSAYANYGDGGRYYDLPNMQYGIYMVLANSSDARTYQPLMIDMVPEQTGPTGNWYMDEKETANLKYEVINIDKKINKDKEGISKESNGEYDIVGAGEIVDFEITIAVPKYPTEDPVQGTGAFTETLFNGYDIMEGGYELIPTSAKIYYIDKDGNILHPTAALATDKNGNLKATDGQNGAKVTYTAILGTDALCYYDKTTGENIELYEVTTMNDKGGSSTTFYGVVEAKMVSVGSSLNEALGAYNAALTAVGESNVTTNTSNLATRKMDDGDPSSEDIKKSFISCEWSYTNLMTSFKYQDPSEDMVYKNNLSGSALDQYKNQEDGTYKTFVPDKVYITYSAIINDKSFLGSDMNENNVIVGYIKDAAHRVSYVWDKTKVWTYGVNIVKVDGATIGDKGTPREDADGNPVTDSEGNQIYDPTYLAGAIFDLYQLDTIYCGGTSAKNSPGTSDYASYNWYADKNANLSDYDAAEDDWQATLKKVATSYYSEDNNGQDKTAIMNNVRTYLGTVYASTLESMTNEGAAATPMGGGWKTADKFGNKYTALFANVGDENQPAVYEYYNKYITGSKNIAVPVKVAKCDKCNTEHYHIDYYQIIRSDITTIDEAKGITVNGLDLGTYLLVETAAPSGYNLLNDAILFEINGYTETQATLADGQISYKGFISDKKLEGTHQEGDGYLQVGSEWYLAYPDGVYPLVVENYTGLTLPSTGGVGTLLFTLIGVAVMGGAFVLVFVKGRKERNMYRS